MTPREIVGYRIREQRTRLGMTQAQLADELTYLSGRKWFAQSVGSAEHGERAFTVEDLIALSIALLTPLELLTTAPQGESMDVGPHRFSEWDELRKESTLKLLTANLERAQRELIDYATAVVEGKITPEVTTAAKKERKKR